MHQIPMGVELTAKVNDDDGQWDLLVAIYWDPFRVHEPAVSICQCVIDGIRVVERRRREYRTPKAPKGVGRGEGCPPGRYLQFTVHCSIDCLNCFIRKKPLLVGKLAVVCMQIAIGRKTSVLDYLSSLFCSKTARGLDFGRWRRARGTWPTRRGGPPPWIRHWRKGTAPNTNSWIRSDKYAYYEVES